MAKNFLVDLNLNQNEVQNGVIQNLASDPSNPIKGQVYFNTTTNKFRCFNGTTWDEMGTGGGTVTSVAVSNATNGGLSISGSPITEAGTINIGHSNVLANAQTTSGIYPIKIDKNGHITEYGTAFDPSTKQNSLSETQLAAVNSGITSAKVTTYDGYANQIAGKQNTIEDLEDIRSGAALGATALQTETDPVFSASAAAGITSTNITNWNNKQNAISDLQTIRDGAAAGATAVQPDDLNAYAPLASPALTGTPTAPTANAGTNTTQIATTAFVTNAISGITGAMVFKGTVGTGGTAGTALPTSNVKVGDTYKIITAGTYAGQAAKIGDLFIASATTPTWAYVPSGDDTDVTQVTAGAGLNTTGPDSSTDGGSITTSGTLNLTKSGVTAGTYQGLTVDKYGRITGAQNMGYTTNTGTVTSVDLTNGGGLTISGGPITTSGSITVGHINSVTAQATQAVYPIAIDANGHITGYGSAQTILKKYSTNITGDASKTSFTITHSLGSRDVVIQVYDNSTYEEVMVDIVRATTTTATISFAKAPASGKVYRVVCIG
jgi:hypothetical protein